MSDPIQLPALRLPQGVSEEQQQFNRAVLQWLQSQRGASSSGSSGAGLGSVFPPGAFTRLAQQARAEDVAIFAAKIVATRVFQNLMASRNDASRFHELDERLQELLRTSIAEEAQARGTAFRQVQEVVSTGLEQRATEIRELTSSVDQAMSGVRELSSSTSREGRATATKVTQVESRLDGFNGGAATIEEVLTTTADQITGLLAQWTMKVTAGGAFAGIGLAADAPTDGPAASYIIMVADNFALVQPDAVIGTGPGEIDPRNPGASRIPFGIDSSGTIFLNGQVRINANGTAVQDVGGAVHAYASGAAWDDTAAATALASFKGNSVKALGDTVTITNGTTFAETRYWSGLAWVNPGVSINGNLLVNGSVTASALAANSVTAAKIVANTITTDRLVANAVTAAQTGSTNSGLVSVAGVSTATITTTTTSLTTTGAPVKILAHVACEAYFGTGKPLACKFEVTPVVDGANFINPITSVTVFDPISGGAVNGSKANVVIPVVIRTTALAAGAHTFNFIVKATPRDGTGGSSSFPAGSYFNVIVSLAVEENKV